MSNGTIQYAGLPLAQKLFEATSKGTEALTAFLDGLSDADRRELGAELALLAAEERRSKSPAPASSCGGPPPSSWGGPPPSSWTAPAINTTGSASTATVGATTQATNVTSQKTNSTATYDASSGQLTVNAANGQSMSFKDDQSLLDYVNNVGTTSPMGAAAKNALDNYYALTGKGDRPITGDRFTPDMAKYLDDSSVRNLPQTDIRRYRFDQARAQILDIVRGRPTDAKVYGTDGSAVPLNPRQMSSYAEAEAAAAILKRLGARNTDIEQQVYGGMFRTDFGQDDRRLYDIHGMNIGLILETYLRNPSTVADQTIGRDLKVT
jgi:hypothetical protein